MGYSAGEVDAIIRLKNTFLGDKPWSDEYRKVKENDFIKYIDEYDKRRGTSFEETYPELMDLKNGISTV